MKQKKELAETQPAQVKPTPEPYEGKIWCIEKKKWIATEKDGDVTYTDKEDEALVFADEAEAVGVLEMLNDSLEDCFTLIDNSDNSYTRNEKPLPTTVRELPEKVTISNDGYILADGEPVIPPNLIPIAKELVRRYNAFPDMLEALKEAKRMYEKVQPAGGWQGVYDEIRHAITSATK